MATWAKGLDFKNSGNTARIGGVGIYGTDTTSEKIYIGFGTEPWNNSGLQVTKSGINYKGNKVYHAGDKPTYSEIGAAAASHSHSNYLPLSGGTITMENYYGVNVKRNHESNGSSIAFSNTSGQLGGVGFQTGKFVVSSGTGTTGDLMMITSSDVTLGIKNVTASKFTGALSGNATTATTLQTARTINGTSFNGSANITTAKWGTARTLTLTGGATGSVSIDGSANVSLATTVNWTNVSGKPSSLPANGGNSDTVDNLHANAFARAHSGGYNFGGNQNAITTAQFIELIKAQGAFNQPVWISRGSWSYANNQYINDTGCGNIHLAGCTIEVIGTSSTYTIRIHTPTTSSSGVTNGEFIYVNNGTDYSPGWRRLYSTKYKPSASDIGAAASSHSHSNYLNRGNWDTNGGQDLLVHGKRALVGMSNGALHLGYGGDFTDIRCGNNWMIWHNNNFNPDSKLGAAHKNSYWGMAQANGDDTNWIRTTSSGIIPYSSNGAGGYGQGSLGTTSWRFKDVFANTGDFNGRVLTDNITARGASLDIYATNNSPHYESNFTVYQGLPGNGLMRFRVDNSNVTSYRDFRADRFRGGANGNDSFYIGAGNFRIEATSNSHTRLYTSAVGATDTGLYMDPGGFWGFKLNSVYKHQFNSNGTKYGGTIEIEGTTYGMSPIDSPQVLIEDVIFNMNLINEETVINLNDIFAKSIDKYAVFPSNKNIEIIAKNKTSFTVRGIGLCDFRIVGTRIDSKDKYYEIMGGFIHGTEEAVTI